MTHILSDTMPSWMKYHDEKDIRIVRKVIINNNNINLKIEIIY